MSTELATRTDQVMQLIEQRRDQLEAVLPDRLPVRKFMQVCRMAVGMNERLRDPKLDVGTLFVAALRCAQDGLLPDGKEAAFNVYKNSRTGGLDVTYLPMVGGIRKIAAAHGWVLNTNVVYANDEFDYTDEPPEIRHRKTRPGVERGPMVAAYAVATHRDGRRLQSILYADEIARRRAKAQTDNVWKEWPEAMWAKSAAHDVFKRLGINDTDLVARITAENGETNVALLYGPDGQTFNASPATSLPAGGDAAEPDLTAEASHATGEAPGTGGSQQAEPAPTILGAGSAPGPDDDPEPGAPDRGLVQDAEIPNGNFQGRTLESLIGEEEGERWLGWALRNPGRFSEFPGFHETLAGFVRVRLPDVWATREEA